MEEVSYPYDPTGLSPANFITREPHVVTELNSNSKRTIVPKFAPFYQNNFLLEYRDNSGIYHRLEPTEHFNLSLIFMGASASLGQRLYGGITIDEEYLNGMFFVSYQILGGEWIADANIVLENIASRIYNPRVATWDQVTNVPLVFPPMPHSEDLNRLKGMEDLLTAMAGIATQLGTPVEPSLLYSEQVVRILAAYEGLALRVGNNESKIARLEEIVNNLR